EGKVTDVKYSVNGTDMSLGDALANQADLKNSRVTVTCQLPGSNPLMMFANNDLSTTATPSWGVDVPMLGGGTMHVQLQRNGFAAGDGSQVFVIFNGVP